MLNVNRKCVWSSSSSNFKTRRWLESLSDGLVTSLHWCRTESAGLAGLIAGDSDHLCAGEDRLTPDWGVEAAWGVSLSANQGVTTPFLWRLKKGGEETLRWLWYWFWICPWLTETLLCWGPVVFSWEETVFSLETWSLYTPWLSLMELLFISLSSRSLTSGRPPPQSYMCSVCFYVGCSGL